MVMYVWDDIFDTELFKKDIIPAYDYAKSYLIGHDFGREELGFPWNLFNFSHGFEPLHPIPAR